MWQDYCMHKSWKSNEKPKVVDWIIKLTDLAEIVKLTSLVKKKKKTYMDFLLKEEKK